MYSNCNSTFILPYFYRTNDLFLKNIDQKLELPINVRRCFDSSKVRYKRKIRNIYKPRNPSRTKDVRICFVFSDIEGF